MRKGVPLPRLPKSGVTQSIVLLSPHAIEDVAVHLCALVCCPNVHMDEDIAVWEWIEIFHSSHY